MILVISSSELVSGCTRRTRSRVEVSSTLVRRTSLNCFRTDIDKPPFEVTETGCVAQAPLLFIADHGRQMGGV